MMRNPKYGVLMVIGMAISACGETHKFDASTAVATDSVMQTPPQVPEDSANSSPQPNSETIPEPGSTPGTEKVPGDCPETKQEVLILDLKSGWWSGDAGNFFQTLLQGLTVPCGDSYVIEFHHILNNANVYQVFPNGKLSAGSVKDIEHIALKSDWSQYSQIWLLSGSYFDRLDLRTNSELFQGILQKIKASGVPLFVGSGNGNLTHANALMSYLGLTSQFYTLLPEGPVVSAKGHFAVTSRLALGAELTPHQLFAGGISSIADDVIALATPAGDKAMQSDGLELGDNFAAVGINHQSRPVIAVRNGGSAKMVLDAGMQRFYAIKDSQENDTLKYLQNIAVYLSIH